VSVAPAPASHGRRLAVLAPVVVVATVPAAVAVMGPPSAQRLARLDQRRSDDLQRIDAFAGSYLAAHGTLPAQLSVLAQQPGWRLAIRDPLDGSPYGYTVTGPRSFRLCAVFATDTALILQGPDPGLAPEWSHGVGPRCFERTVPRPRADAR